MVSDMQLTTLDELEDHIADMPEDDLKELKVDIHNFLDYWPRSSKQHTVDDISHIFGVVRPNVKYMHLICFLELFWCCWSKRKRNSFPETKVRHLILEYLNTLHHS